jgi:hypothetical protein
MWYEWSGRYIQVDKFNRGSNPAKKGDIMYYPYSKNGKLHLQKVQIDCIEYDANAPEYRFEEPIGICNISKLKFLGGKKWLEVPLWLCSKDKMKARNIFITQNKQLHQIKLRKTKEK